MEKQILQQLKVAGECWVFFNPATNQVIAIEDATYDTELKLYVFYPMEMRV